ncbi:MAG TPA: FHA domain-containing protein [Longimicrobium sp.]
MAAELHVLTGERAGVVLRLTGADCTVGRHPDAALRFAGPSDAAVSAHHARVERDGGGWRLRDLASTNGTWLNGRRVSSPARLRDGDRITLGPAGPVLEFRMAGARRPAAARPPREGGRRRMGVPAAFAAGAIFATLAGAAAIRLAPQRGAAPSPPPAPALAGSPPAGAPSLTDLPSSSDPPAARSASPRGRTPRTHRPPDAAPSAASPASPSSSPLMATAAESTAAVPRVVDVGRGNRLAVARIFVEDEDGVVVTGTAFAVRGDALLVTSRHVVTGGNGRGTPRQIAVQFAASSQRWPARLAAASDEADLALVRVEGIEGAVPTVRGLNLRPDTLPAGAPLMVAGFPGAGDPVRGQAARLVLTPATLAAVRGGRVEVFARSAAGASGSPVFDADGQVIAVLYGGAPRAERPLLLGISADAVARLLGR